MASIRGHITTDHCPVCKVECKWTVDGPLEDIKNYYDHPEDGHTLVSGIPVPCNNNGKRLRRDEVVQRTRPDIVSSGIDGVY